jgi:hypothetical protein
MPGGESVTDDLQAIRERNRSGELYLPYEEARETIAHLLALVGRLEQRIQQLKDYFSCYAAERYAEGELIGFEVEG